MVENGCYLILDQLSFDSSAVMARYSDFLRLGCQTHHDLGPHQHQWWLEENVAPPKDVVKLQSDLLLFIQVTNIVRHFWFSPTGKS